MAPRPASPTETGGGRLLAALGLVLAAYWLAHYQPFLLPNNDYPSFERVARSLLALELPQSFQRMPIFPALMALVAPWLPEPHPFLHAALALNLAFGLGTLLLLHRLAARTIGRGALLLPVLFAAATQLHTAALQPLVEPSLCFFVVLAFVLFQARSRWQWLAAFAAALSRYEAAMLIPVLFVVNWRDGARLGPLLLDAALASSGVVLWLGLGALHGSGGSTYLDLMSGMGFRPALDFLERSVREPFRGWYREPFGPGFAIFVALVGGVTAAGVARGLREFRRESLALLGFLVTSVAVIVVFGINKARYVYPSEWIPLLFFAAGCLDLLARGRAWLAARPAAVARGALLAAAALLAVAVARWVPRVVAEASASGATPELAFGAALVAILAAALRGEARRAPPAPDAEGTSPRAARAAAALLLLAVATPLVGGGLQGTRRELRKIHDANYGSVVAARWLAEHLAPGERAVVLPREHILHLTGLEDDQLLIYGQLEATDLASLRAEMSERGAVYALYTWRKPLQTPSDDYYDRKLKAYLSREFRGGGAVAGFEHVATLELPGHLGRDAVQVYRLAPGEAS